MQFKFKQDQLYDFRMTLKYGDWRLNGETKYIFLSKLNNLLTEKKLCILNLDDISWRGKNKPLRYRREKCLCCKGSRYKLADISVPLISLLDSSNPMNKPYTLLDGKHRAEKMLSNKIPTAKSYIFTIEEIQPFLLSYEEFLSKINSNSLGS